jgi:hypothetical protein
MAGMISSSGSILRRTKQKLSATFLLSRYGQEDKMIWRLTQTGEFTVRRAYYLEKERTARRGGQCSRVVENNIWKSIWSLTVPNSTRMFIWRMCNNILPTKENLLKVGVVNDSMCVICNREPETVMHDIWECPAAQDVWGGCPRRIQKFTFSGREMQDFMEALWSWCSREEMDLCAIIARGIWMRRNELK